MSWLSKLIGAKPGSEDVTLLKLRVTRFGQLLRGAEALSALREDAAEKQGGGFILDRQYVISLAEQVAELAEGVVFDLNVLTSRAHLSLYERADQLRNDLRGIFAKERHGGAEDPGRIPVPVAPAEPVSPAELTAALARFPVVFRECGQVACRGVAAGPVCILADRAEPGDMTTGSVFVASDLTSEDGVLAAVRRAGAILLDRGSAAGTAARLAREFRIPAIVGLGDATSRLASRSEVTVDADENVVYLGRVDELLDYYRLARLSTEEEPEYRLLRSVRQIAFPSTLASGQKEKTSNGCRTVHDLVSLARSLASDALGALLAGQGPSAGAVVALPEASWCDVRMFRLEDPLSRDGGGAIPLSGVSSRPLSAFLEGLSSEKGEGGESPERMPPCALKAAATDEHTLAVVTSPGGIDLLDATAGEGRETNAIYGRFVPRGPDDPGEVRGAFVAGVLSRLDFTTTLTDRDVTGWIRGLPGAETHERLRVLGRLETRLTRLSPGSWKAVQIENDVDAFIRSCA